MNGCRAMSTQRHTLSSLSTAEEIVRIFSGGTPHVSKIPSNILRLLICRASCSTGKRFDNVGQPSHLDCKLAHV